MKLCEWLDSWVYDALFALFGGSTLDPVFGYWWADTYAIWRGKEVELSGKTYDQLATYWNSQHNYMLWRAGGGGGVSFVYGFGYWCGGDKDLLCISTCADEATEECLSPLCSSAVGAFILFIRARVVVWVTKFRGSSIKR